MSGIDILKDLFTQMKNNQLETWEENCPYSQDQVEMYKFTVEHYIQGIESQRYLEEFTLNFFNDLANVVYKEKQGIGSFNNYVKTLVLEDLEREKGCEYCKDYNNPKSDVRQDEDFCTISHFEDRRGDKTGGFNYCPICGRKL